MQVPHGAAPTITGEMLKPKDIDFVERRSAAKDAKLALLERAKARLNSPEAEQARLERIALAEAREAREAQKKIEAEERAKAEAQRKAEEIVRRKQEEEARIAAEAARKAAEEAEKEAARQAQRDARKSDRTKLMKEQMAALEAAMRGGGKS
ncbi:DUF6481 family protein [Aurantimonas sp. Leaf443]|uniref:DUF6481 family protein n=1 Tax=Aurantimonas sp. Leaf443 TaxID=1736378 RepID=UPI0012E35375|nr:DUF6481 family protein [Aurantimonas sp. Leaf443]